MSVVLYPVLLHLGQIAFALRVAFVAGLAFVYIHVACAAPAPENIEGFVYLKDRFFKKSSFFKFQFEMIIYSVALGLTVGGLLF